VDDWDLTAKGNSSLDVSEHWKSLWRDLKRLIIIIGHPLDTTGMGSNTMLDNSVYWRASLSGILYHIRDNVPDQTQVRFAYDGDARIKSIIDKYFEGREYETIPMDGGVTLPDGIY
jgi:hypothetical protein